MNEIGCKTGVDMRAAMLLGELLASLNAHQLDLLAETLDRLHPNPASLPDPDEMEPGERRRRKEKADVRQVRHSDRLHTGVRRSAR